MAKLLNQHIKGIDEKRFFRGLTDLFKAVELMVNIGVVHHDLKADNIVVDDYKFRLIDFGQSWSILPYYGSKPYFTRPNDYLLLGSSKTKTKDGLRAELNAHYVGMIPPIDISGGYMSEEDYFNAIKNGIDVYALGKVLVHVMYAADRNRFVGKQPYEKGGYADLSFEPKDITTLRPKTPRKRRTYFDRFLYSDEVVEFVKKLIDPDSELRISAKEARIEYENIVKGHYGSVSRQKVPSLERVTATTILSQRQLRIATQPPTPKAISFGRTLSQRQRIATQPPTIKTKTSGTTLSQQRIATQPPTPKTFECLLPPSRGGMSFQDVKIMAKRLGVPVSKSSTKKGLCEKIVLAL